MPEEVKPGEYYYGVVCEECGDHLPLWKANPVAPVRIEGEGILAVTCPNPDCRHDGRYSTDKIITMVAQAKPD